MSCTEVSFVRFFLAGRYTAVVSQPQSTPGGTGMGIILWMVYVSLVKPTRCDRAQEVCESRGGHPGLPSLIVSAVSVDVLDSRP